MEGGMDGRITCWTDGLLIGWMNGWICWMDGWITCWMDEGMD